MSSMVASSAGSRSSRCRPRGTAARRPSCGCGPSSGSSACRSPRNAQSKIERCSSFNPGAPSIVSCSSMYATIASISAGCSRACRAPRHRAVHDLQHSAADELLVLHQRDVRLDAGRVAVHHERDRAGRREHRDLRVLVACAAAERAAPRASSRARPRADRRARRRRHASAAAVCIPITSRKASRFFA